MPVNRQPPRRPAATMLAGALLAGAMPAAVHAQTLPRRENVEHARIGEVERLAGRGRHAVVVAPPQGALVPVDGSRFVDLHVHAGPAPRVWSSTGGALFVERPLQPTGPDRFSVDTAETGARWLALDADDTARVELHARFDGARGGADPWLVPLAPRAERDVRTQPDRRDRVLELAGPEPAVYAIDGERHLRVDLWRAQAPRLLPADASWLRVEADGRTIFEGRTPAPPQRERLHVTDGCAQVLDLAGRLRIDVPAGTRELRVHGEPGTWIKLLAPLPGTPVAALDVESDPRLDRLVQRPGESLQAAFERAVAAYPDPRAQNFLARYAYYRPVAVQPADAAALHTRRLRPRYPERGQRGTFETNPPTPATPGPAPLAFHWLAPGARWRLDAGTAGAGLLRVSVAHPAPSADARLRLSQSGGAQSTLRLDAATVAALDGASAAADALLALAPAAADVGDAIDEPASSAPAPVVDASQAVLPRASLAAPLTLENTGGTGVWVAVEQRVPAPRTLADAALGSAAIAPAQLRDALLDAPPLRANDQHDALGATRALDAARRLLDARRRGFADEPCVQAAREGDPAQALDTFAQARSVDPVLARCAVLQAAAIAPGDPRTIAALTQWAAQADQGDLLTGFHAWALQRGAARADAARWQRLATALEAEGEAAAAALAARAAGASASTPHTGNAPAATVPVSATRSAGAARLRTDRDSELAYARADARPAQWIFDRAGPHVIELRSLTPQPQWAQLRSGGRTWWVWLPGADAASTALRDVAGDAAPGLGVRVAFDVAAPGQALEVSGGAGAVLARVETHAVDTRAMDTTAARIVPAPDPVAVRDVRVAVAGRCAAQHALAPLTVARSGAPAVTSTPANAAPIEPAPDAPVLDARASDARTAAQAALQALQAIEAGRPDAAQVAAARAIALRGEATDAPAAPGLFAELDRHLAWRRLAPVAHGGAVSREVADGRSSNPLIARREQWAGAVDDARFVLRPGQGWVLDGLQPNQSVQLRAQLRAALDDRVELRAGDAAPRLLHAGEAVTLAARANADGALRVRVGEALPGTFVELTVADASGKAIDPRRPVRYHRGPVEVAVTAPTVLRIVEWNGRTSVVRTQWVAGAGTLRLQPQRLPGAALRVSALDVDPAPPRAPPDTAATDPTAADATATATLAPGAPAAAPLAPLVPAPAPPWPDAWPASGGEDGTWGVLASISQRSDADNPDARRERFGELRWRYRYRIADRNLWGRLDAVGRRHDLDFGVIGLEHDLQWRQDDGPWGASLDASVWQQRAPAGLDSPARAVNLRAAVEWSRRRDERWRDEWSLGLRARELSLRDVPRGQTARLDNDVYSRYRDRHRTALDLGVRTAWRMRYDSELVFDAIAISNPLSDFGLDQAGAGVAWRWTRHGWTASAGLDVRHYLRDARRARADTRSRVELALGRIFLGHDTGWRLRFATGYDTATRDAQVGVTVEWFDHDGRGLTDWSPSELYLRNVLETDLVAPLVPPDPLP